eukprot:g13545.t1
MSQDPAPTLGQRIDAVLEPLYAEAEQHRQTIAEVSQQQQALQEQLAAAQEGLGQIESRMAEVVRAMAQQEPVIAAVVGDAGSVAEPASVAASAPVEPSAIETDESVATPPAAEQAPEQGVSAEEPEFETPTVELDPDADAETVGEAAALLDAPPADPAGTAESGPKVDLTAAAERAAAAAKKLRQEAASNFFRQPAIPIDRPALEQAFATPRAALVVYRHLLGQPNFLLISTRRDPKRLTLPGGKVDAHETPLESAIRETLEEAGVLTARHQPLCRYEHEKASGKVFPTQTFLAQYVGYQPGHEQRALHWLTVSELWDASRTIRQPIREQIERAIDLLPAFTAAALQVSPLTLGGLFTSDLGGGVEATVETLTCAFDLGINFIDTAPAYANSEETLGQALKLTPNVPDDLVISTKLGGRPQPFDARDKAALLASAEESLRLLGRDVIDVLIIHEPDRPQQYPWWTDPQQAEGPVMEVLDTLKQQGKVRYTGLGGTTVNEMRHLVASRKFDVLLAAFNYSLLFREAAIDLLPTAQTLGMGVMSGSVLQQGGLAKRYDEALKVRPVWMSPLRHKQFLALYQLLDETGLALPELGVRFAAAHPAISTVLLGTSNPKHLEAGIRDIEKGPLPKDLVERLDTIAAMLPYRPFEEPMVLPMGKPYFGPGMANLGEGIQQSAVSESSDSATLQTQLDARKAQWAETADDNTKAIYDDGIARVKATGVLGTMKGVGDKAPSFTLPNAVGQEVASADLLAEGPIVVVFYRGVWCPYCNLTLAEWQAHLDEIQGLGAQLVTISPQLPDYSLDSQQKNELKFPVLSDVGNKVSDAFGITTQVTPEIIEIWKGKIDLEAQNGDASARLPLPATYLIGSDGMIHFAHAHEDYRVRAEPEAVIEKLRELTDPDSLLSAAYANPTPQPRRRSANDKLNVLSIGVIGTIGGADRQQVNSHPSAQIVGLCDVDSNALNKAASQTPGFQVADYREAFDKYGDKFDAVICATPDHTHCPIDTLALSKGKHVYGQKPLVQQLEEVYILKAATEANPNLSTQMGNQRMQSPGRRAAVHVMKSGMLGKVKEIFVTTGSGLRGGGRYFNNREDFPVEAPPKHLDWDLWQGGVQEIDYRPGLAPIKWRAFWDYGTGGLGDWGCHLLDVIFYSFPELDSPIAVQAEVTDPPEGMFHAYKSKTVMTYPTTTDAFAAKTVKVHYRDEGQVPSKAELGLPDSVNPTTDKNQTVFVCEGGTLILTAGGKLEIWREGKNEKWQDLPGMPKFQKFNHWHEWVNTALGNHNPDLHWSPFGVGCKITEASLLPVKATKFPGVELQWDRDQLAFTNHAEATKTIVKRDYRKGFEPVRV